MFVSMRIEQGKGRRQVSACIRTTSVRGVEMSQGGKNGEKDCSYQSIREQVSGGCIKIINASEMNSRDCAAIPLNYSPYFNRAHIFFSVLQ